MKNWLKVSAVAEGLKQGMLHTIISFKGRGEQFTSRKAKTRQTKGEEKHRHRNYLKLSK